MCFFCSFAFLAGNDSCKPICNWWRNNSACYGMYRVDILVLKMLIVGTFNEQNIHKQVITTVTVCKNMSHLRRNPCHWSRHCCCSNNSMIDGNHNNFNGTETYICLRPRLGRRIFCYRCPNHAGWDRSLHFCCVLHPQKKS